MEMMEKEGHLQTGKAVMEGKKEIETHLCESQPCVSAGGLR